MRLSRGLTLKFSASPPGLPSWMRFKAAPDCSPATHRLAGEPVAVVTQSRTTAVGTVTALSSPPGKSASLVLETEAATSYPARNLEKSSRAGMCEH